MGEADKLRIPSLKPEVDLTALPIGPAEGFIMSRIDGRTPVGEIADMTGLPVSDVMRVVDMLMKEGLAEWVRPRTPSRSPSYPPEGLPSSRPPIRGTSESTPPRNPPARIRTKPPPPGTSRTLYDPHELEEPDVDLDRERRRTILDTYYRLDELTLYEVLGVDPRADRKEIRAAYFGLSKVFHPDTLYGKRLGTYKSKMEGVFKRLTEAYDTLGKKKRRQEYDEYIALRAQTEVAEHLLDAASREAERIAHQSVPAEPPVDEAPRSARPSEPPTKEYAVLPEPETKVPSDAPTEKRPVAAAAGSAPPEVRSEAAKKRSRQLMARKISAATRRRMPLKSGEPINSLPPQAGSLPPPGSSKPPFSRPPGGRVSTPPDQRMSRDVLLRGLTRSLKDAATVTGVGGGLDARLDEARRAEAARDLVAATQALRLAVALSNESPEVVAEFDRVSHLMAESLAETYEKQALYEEKNKRFGEAALSWIRVCDGRPEDPAPKIRAARALLESGRDLPKARKYAQEAVHLDPGNSRAQRVLGQVFHAAGMTASARTALEKTLKLDPRDEIAENLLRDLGK